MSKIYDSFLFFNELDLLEIRLNVLDPVVDYFIISESDVTFSGKQKPFYYLENQSRFSKFAHKIIHQKVLNTPNDFTALVSDDRPIYNKILGWIDEAENFPKNVPHWGRDFYQRESLHFAYERCRDEDIVVFSDIDEIPNPETLSNVILKFPTNEIFTLRQLEFNYYLNAFKKNNWRGPRVAQYSTLRDLSLNKIRTILPGDKMLIETVDVPLGGWHFTNLGNVEKVIQKIESWGHQEFNTDDIKAKISDKIRFGEDAFGRESEPSLQRIELCSPVFPEWLVSNQSRFQHLVRIEPFSKRSKLKKVTQRLISFYLRILGALTRRLRRRM